MEACERRDVRQKHIRKEEQLIIIIIILLNESAILQRKDDINWNRV